MDDKDVTQQEAEYAGFVDRGTQVVLQEAIQKVVETFSQTDALEDILGYLEEMRESMQNTEERMKEIQHREKQINDKVGGTETSMRNLLQRIQTLEVQMAETCDKVNNFKGELNRLTTFFEKAPLARMFSRLPGQEEETEEEPMVEETPEEKPEAPRRPKDDMLQMIVKKENKEKIATPLQKEKANPELYDDEEE